MYFPWFLWDLFSRTIVTLFVVSQDRILGFYRVIVKVGNKTIQILLEMIIVNSNSNEKFTHQTGKSKKEQTAPQRTA